MPVRVETPQSLKELVGEEIAVTNWLLVAQEQIQSFAETTHDQQWIHVDVERAKRESPYGETVAHGFFTLSLLSHFVREAVQISSGVRMAINYGLNRVRFPAPVRVSERLRGRISLIAAKDIPDGLEATFHVVVETEHGDKPCCVAEWVMRYYS